jgi:DNA primase
MAKISPVSIKYNIEADFQSEGPVEKPDVIGALFGQTEGLLGSDMELRELQQEGKIGRIDVNLTTENGKTKGKIIIPTALDKAETSIIAATLETIDKIGPTDAKLTITKIEDIRGSKRDYIMERAKKLLAEVQGTGLESQEMHQELKESSRTSKLTEYGEEKLPAGDISGNEIIVVEGRADVVNLLKHGIDNVIGMNGTKLPAEISKLGEEKKITLFVDGDRGGKLIAKNVCDNAKIEEIAQAPSGMEVEELTGKEIHMALRRAVSPTSFLEERESRGDKERDKPLKTSLTEEDKEKLKEIIESIKGKNVLVLNQRLEIVRDMPASKLPFSRAYNVFVVMAEHASTAVIDGAEKLGARYVVAKSFARTESESVELVSI